MALARIQATQPCLSRPGIDDVRRNIGGGGIRHVGELARAACDSGVCEAWLFVVSDSGAVAETACFARAPTASLEGAPRKSSAGSESPTRTTPLHANFFRFMAGLRVVKFRARLQGVKKWRGVIS